MIEGIKFRHATSEDIEFIVESIIEAEKSGSNVITSCNIFSITENKFKEILRELLLQDIPDYDYYLSGYLIAEKDGEYIGSLGSWLEADNGVASGIIKATLLLPYLDKAELKTLNKNTSIIKGLTITRKPGSLQLEHGYTREAFRRQGVFTSIIKEIIKVNGKKYKNFTAVQGAVLKENYKSYNAHLKIGYEVVEERRVDDPQVLKFFPYNVKVLLELSEAKFSKFI